MKKLFSFLLVICTVCVWGAAEVANFGVPGLVAAGISGSRMKELAAFKPDLVVVMVGTDDFANPRRLTATETYTAQMKSIIRTLRKIKAVPVIVNVPPVRDISAGDLPKYKNVAPNDRIKAANAALKTLAVQEKVLLIDLHAKVTSAKNAAPAEYLRRGFFTAADSKVLAEMVAGALKNANLAPKRIACIGGADTFGYRLNGAGTVTGEPWPAELKRLLNNVSYFKTVAPLPGQQVFRAGWIWAPETFLNRRNELRGFRKTLTLTSKAVSAPVTFTGDDRAVLYVNGKKAGEVRNWKRPVTTDVAPLLVPGKNVFALEVLNGSVDGGGLLKGEIRCADGKRIEVCTDSDWKALRITPGDLEWTRLSYDDSGAPSAWRMGDAGAIPWVVIAGFDYRLFLYPDELSAREKSRSAAAVRYAEIARKLAKEPAPRMEIRYVNGSPKFAAGNQLWDPVTYKGSYYDPRDYRDLVYADDFRKAGIHLYGLNFTLRDNDYWTGDNEYHFQNVTDTLYRLLAMDPEARFLIGIGVNAPEWWMKKHPGEAVGYGRPGAEPAYSAKDQYRALRASYASAVWRRDAGEALKALVKMLEGSPLKSRIIAYMPQGGVYDSEWHYYGMRGDMPDTGKPMTAFFRTFLREKYGNRLPDLREAWKDPAVTFENAQVPGIKERMHRLSGGIRTVTDSPKVTDYLLCHQRVVRETILHFNRMVREAAGKRPLIGNYTGYFFEMTFPVEGWHIENTKILDSGLVDFQCSPYGYGDHRGWGAAGLARAVTTSYRLRNKMLLYEDDTRTHLNFVSGGHYAYTPEESSALLARAFVNALCGGTGIWFLDFERGWYHDPVILKTMASMKKTVHRNLPCGSAAKVALVCDFESVLHHSYSDDRRQQLTSALIDGVALELTHTGTPWEPVLVEDLLTPGLPDYQLYIFCNMLKSSPEREKITAELRRRGKSIVWLYAPGIIRNGVMTPEAVQTLTGFRVRQIAPKGFAVTETARNASPFLKGIEGRKLVPPRRRQVADSPVFALEIAPGVQPLGSVTLDGVRGTSLAVRQEGKRFELLHTVPFLSRELLRNVFRQAGIPLWIDRTDCAFYANSSYAAIHNDRGGEIRVSLPGPRRVKQVFPEEKVLSATPVKSFVCRVPDHHTVLFELLP